MHATRANIVGPALAAAFALALLGPIVPVASAKSDMPAGAAGLMQLDPAARLGGNTQVATAPGARLWGVPGRVNFMIALGPNERIEGGPGADQLGVRGTADRVDGRGGNDLISSGHGDDVLRGGSGNDLIDGGGGADRLSGGPGDDRLVSIGGAATVLPGPGTDSVDVRDGQGDDRVVCAPGSDDRVMADPGDRIGSACHTAQPARAPVRPPARAAQASVTGDGSNGNPFTAPCSTPGADCSVNSFAARHLGGFWSNEYIPAYKCPTDHPYLIYGDWAPSGTTVPSGVEVSGLGPVGVSITGISSTKLPRPGLPPRDMVTGTTTGLGASSATNWDGYGSAYTIILHCTSDDAHGYTTTGPQ